MKKFSVAAVLAASLVSSAVAIDLDGFFVGASGDYNFKSQLKGDWYLEPLNMSSKFDFDESNFGLGLKIGYDFGEWRIYEAYSHTFESKSNNNIVSPLLLMPGLSEETKWSSNDFILGADWTPKFSLGGIDFKGIVGAFGGLSILDVKYLGTSAAGNLTADYTQNGFIYGLRLGGIYEINKNNEIELGFKFDQAMYQETNIALIQHSLTLLL